MSSLRRQNSSPQQTFERWTSRTHESPWVSASKWGKTEASVSKRGKCVSTQMQSQDPRLLIAQEPNNAQNAQQKLGVAFSYLERQKQLRLQLPPLCMMSVNCIPCLCVPLWNKPIHMQDFHTYSIQETQDFINWFRSTYTAFSKRETTRWQDLKASVDVREISRSTTQVLNKPFRHLARVRQSFSIRGIRKHMHVKHIDARPLRKIIYVI